MEERVELHMEQKVNHKPRICKMVKGPHGFGFSLNMIKNKPGLFITEVLIKNEEQGEAQVILGRFLPYILQTNARKATSLFSNVLRSELELSQTDIVGSR